MLKIGERRWHREAFKPATALSRSHVRGGLNPRENSTKVAPQVNLRSTEARMKKDDSGEVLRELSVGDVAQRSGVAVSAIHFYEAKGLITSWRNRANQRRYPREALRRVSIIKVAQRLGIP